MNIEKLLEPGSRVFTFQGQHFVLLMRETDCWNVARARERGGKWYRIGQPITPFATKLIEHLEQRGAFITIG